jgi:hypothetical protein
MYALRPLLLLGLLAATPVAAQVYRWVDDKGTVHYSNAAPPKGVKATVIEANVKPGPPSPESTECYTVRCQGERLEERLARRERIEARDYAERIAATPPRPRGLDFRAYVSLSRGMTEGELVTIAGKPDMLSTDRRAITTYTYLPTPGDPFVTTITLTYGRISEIDRVRKF